MGTSTIERVDLQLSDEEIKLLEKARSMPITFDKDCPETTPERAIRYRRVNRPEKTVVQ